MVINFFLFTWNCITDTLRFPQLEQIAMTEKYKSWINDVSILQPTTVSNASTVHLMHLSFATFRAFITNACGSQSTTNAYWRHAKCTHILRIPSAVFACSVCLMRWMMSFLVNSNELISLGDVVGFVLSSAQIWRVRLVRICRCHVEKM